MPTNVASVLCAGFQSSNRAMLPRRSTCSPHRCSRQFQPLGAGHGGCSGCVRDNRFSRKPNTGVRWPGRSACATDGSRSSTVCSRDPIATVHRNNFPMSTQRIQDPGEVLGRHLQRFYQDQGNFDQLVGVLNAESKDTGVSLRMLDFLVTNYCSQHRVEYLVERKGKAVWCNLYHAYRQQLQQFSKVYFDPFARRKKFVLQCGSRKVQTTPGQMNFFKWAIEWGVLDYARRNVAELRATLPLMRTERVEGRRKRRRQPPAQISVHIQPCIAVLRQPVSAESILGGVHFP